MKTLIYTSIYANLWGTEYGGRPNRGVHYRESLLNILNLSADKYICFTSPEEIESLENWFYLENNIEKKKLKLISFDLKNSKYFNEIQKLKNIDEIKKSQRSFEVQYNKFFWLENINNIDEYDRIYWFDAGLSHNGIFPEKYSIGKGRSRYFKFSLFNNDYLKYLNDLTKEKIILAGKNNTGNFYWSTTVPSKYYTKFNKSLHIIGGFFGGPPNLLINFKEKFEDLLVRLLSEENNLYFEELLMSCLYQNYNEDFIVLKFDDWYNRNMPDRFPENTSYFYNIFEI